MVRIESKRNIAVVSLPAATVERKANAGTIQGRGPRIASQYSTDEIISGESIHSIF
jgi:hypothetical protein